MEPSKDIEVSIIIPNLNSPIADNTVQSIIEQCSVIKHEIIVVGLDENRLLVQFEGRIKNVDTYTPVPPGIARNIGVNHSSGKYLIFIDSDAIAQKEFIKKHHNLLKGNGKLLVGGAVTFPKHKYLTLCDNIATFHEYMEHLPRSFKRMVPTVNMSISRRDFLILDGFIDSPAGEDADFSYRARKNEIKVLFAPEIKIAHLPPRETILDVIKHSYKLGSNSKIIIEFLNKKLKIPLTCFSKILLLVFSPFTALLILFRILFIEKLPVKYWHTLPTIYFLKVVWSIGFSINAPR
jgi:glycosyltransferase involved in cell wall biosynthesis